MAQRRLSRWLRSSHVRFIGLILLLELLFGGALLLSVTQLVRSDLDEADSAIVIQARDALTAVAREQGDRALRDAIAEQIEEQRDAILLLTGADGRRISGNLAVWPVAVPASTRWTKLDLARFGDTQPRAFGVATTRLSDGRRLLVGQRTDDSDEIRRMLESAMATALLMALPLTLIGAWLVVFIIDRRVSHIAATAAGVRAGDIDRRVPLDGSGDSFDKLGIAINAMLDRIGGLLIELRTVTDSIAHDLRSPLTRLRARIDRAMATDDPEALREAIDGIGREADHLLAMLSTALEISRMEAGIARDRFVPTDLAAMLEDIGDLYAPLVEEQGRSLAVSADAGAIYPMHRELMGQALSNLIDNALKYASGAMVLRLSVDGEGYVVALVDEGAGIPPEREIEAVRRFGRLDAARGIPGAGLGLSLVAAVAQIHGGCIRFRRSDGRFAVEIALPPRP